MDPKTGKGGRPAGAKNVRTLVREKLMKSSDVATKVGESGYIAPPEDSDKAMLEAIAGIKGGDFIMEALNAMGEALGVYLTVARREPNIDKRLALYGNAAGIAQKLAPFTFPTLASIHTTQSKQSALERVGSVEQEEYDKLMLEIAEKGISRQVEAFITGPKKSGGGTKSGGGNGGVANR